MKWFVVIHTLLEYSVFTAYNICFYHILTLPKQEDTTNILITEKILLLLLLVLIGSELIRLPFRNNYIFDESVRKVNYFLISEGCIYFVLLIGYAFVLIESTFSFHVTKEVNVEWRHNNTILVNTILLIMYIISFPLGLRRVLIAE